jgi:hypothetical protein
MSDEKKRCRARVSNQAFWGMSECARYAVTDGYCKQHHPDSVKARNDAARARYEEKWAKDPLVLANNEITKLRQSIAELKAKLKSTDESYRAAFETCKDLHKDIAFLQSCVNSGETAKPSDRPSQQVIFPTMKVCHVCHNKRCPKALDALAKCTNSNEPDQQPATGDSNDL